MLLVLAVLPSLAIAQAPPVDSQYAQLFVHFVDRRSLDEKVLNRVGLTTQEVGRSFALIAGVSSYPHLAQNELRPAAQDIRLLVDYLKRVEGFDEIVVLQDANMTMATLGYFLQGYFPKRLAQFPKSRFLFAYSGHGFNDGERGYLLQSAANSFDDKVNSINLKTLRVFTDEVVDSGHHVLVLINSCYSGAFLTRMSFNQASFLPRSPGAHAITAGGSRERTWHDANIGAGSIFFEKLLAGLDGRADIFPARVGNGLITVEELYTYLRQEVQISTDQAQNPQWGDLSRSGSDGGFFFLNRKPLVDARLLKPWQPAAAAAFSAPRPVVPAAPASISSNGVNSTQTSAEPKYTSTGLFVYEANLLRPHQKMKLISGALTPAGQFVLCEPCVAGSLANGNWLALPPLYVVRGGGGPTVLMGASNDGYFLFNHVRHDNGEGQPFVWSEHAGWASPVTENIRGTIKGISRHGIVLFATDGPAETMDEYGNVINPIPKGEGGWLHVWNPDARTLRSKHVGSSVKPLSLSELRGVLFETSRQGGSSQTFVWEFPTNGKVFAPGAYLGGGRKTLSLSSELGIALSSAGSLIGRGQGLGLLETRYGPRLFYEQWKGPGMVDITPEGVIDPTLHSINTDEEVLGSYADAFGNRTYFVWIQKTGRRVTIQQRLSSAWLTRRGVLLGTYRSGVFGWNLIGDKGFEIALPQCPDSQTSTKAVAEILDVTDDGALLVLRGGCAYYVRPVSK